MTTAIIQKTVVEPSWTRIKVQEEASSAVTGQMFATTRILASAAPELLSQIRQEWSKLRVEYFRAQGVRTPLDLVRAWAEYDANMFGSTLRYWGDEKQAHVEYNHCACWSVLEHLTSAESEQASMSTGWAQITQMLATQFGFTGSEKIGTEPGESCCTLTFSATA